MKIELGREEYPEGSCRPVRILYYLQKYEREDRPFAFAEAIFLEDHYVLMDFWGGRSSVDSVWAEHQPQLRGIEHRAREASKRLYRLMKGRGRKIAKLHKYTLIDRVSE